MMDRNEGDQRGNIAEMKRLLEGLGLDVAAVWPDGGGWATLDRVARAGAIISLPYGRAAARIVAERTGARLLETGVPCGLEGTRAWLEAVGEALGVRARAAKLVESELDRIVPRIARAVPFYFLNRGAAIFADPYLMPGLAGLCAGLGMRVRLSAFMARGKNDLPGEGGAPVTVSEPLQADLDRMVSGAGLRSNDLVICNGEMSNFFRRRYAVLELGVPSYTHHVFPDAPFLGFTGALQLIDRMAGALSLDAE
jgi:nitrogenase molybdenum-iron protein alpha/beta subunit